MPYTKSTSRCVFEEITNELLAQAKQSNMKKHYYASSIIQLVYKAAIFQTSAALEQYIESVIEDWVSLIKKTNKKSKHLPKEAIHYLISKKRLNDYIRYLLDKNESDFINRMISNSSILQLVDPDADVSAFLTNKVLIGDRKYPSVRNYRMVFFRVGIPNIFKALGEKGKGNYQDILQSFNDIRNEIAHEYSSKQLAIEDVKDQIYNMQALVQYTDRILYSHISKVSGNDCWHNGTNIILYP